MKSLLAFIFLFLPTLGAYAQAAASVIEKPLDHPAEIRLESFEKVWNTVNEKHYDPTFGGIDWKLQREIYEPKAAAAKTDAEFHAVLRQMLGELKLSHFGIHPKAIDWQAAASARGVTGIDIKMLDGQPVIDRVDADSPAALAGIKPGFIIKAVDGQTVAALTKPLTDSIAGRKISDAMWTIYTERTIEGFINGAAKTAVKLDVLNANDRPQTFRFERAVFAGQMSQALGNFPPQEVVFESRRLPENIGYVRFNMWVVPQIGKIRAAIREFSDSRGLVIDLRGNPGGIGGMASGIAGNLMDKQVSLGTMKSRHGATEFTVFPQADAFLGKIVILIDHGSGSTSEVFAAGMQETGRATLIGTTSAGAVLPSVFEKLPTDVLFQYAISDYRSPKNILIEGRGVVPDIAVKQTRKARLAGRDAQLDAAVKHILDK